MVRYQVRADVALAAGRLSTRLLGRRALMALSARLGADERVQQISPASYRSAGGMLARTDCRLLFVRAGLAGSAFAEWPLAAVSDVDWTPGVLAGTLTVTVAGQEVALHQVPDDDGARLTAALAPLPPAGLPRPDRAPAPAAPWVRPPRRTPRASSGDVAAQLRELVERRRTGELSQEEFQALQADVLRRS